MRVLLNIFFFSIFIFWFGCKPDYGAHKIIAIEGQHEASDDVYIEFLGDQIDRNPGEEYNYIKLAKIYLERNDISKSLEILKVAQKENPESLGVLVGLSNIYLELEDAAELSVILKSISKIDPDDVGFLKASAGYSLLLHDYTNAIYFSNRAILLNPFDDENMYLRGSAQLINKDSVSALASFEEAYKLKESYTNFYKIFQISLAIGNSEQAKNILNQYSLKNSEAELCYEWGAYFNEVASYDTARIILIKCQAEKPDEKRIFYELAKNYYKSNDTDSALIFVDRYLAESPKGIDGLIFKAKMLERRRDYNEAKKIYQTAIEKDSTSILAINGLENLERKVAYLRLVKRKEEAQRQTDNLKPLDSKEIN